MVMDAAGNVAREGFETATYVLDLTSGNAATALAASAAAEGRHVDAAELDAASAAEQQGVLALIDGLRQLLENPGQHKIVYGAEQVRVGPVLHVCWGCWGHEDVYGTRGRVTGRHPLQALKRVVRGTPAILSCSEYRGPHHNHRHNHHHRPCTTPPASIRL